MRERIKAPAAPTGINSSPKGNSSAREKLSLWGELREEAVKERKMGTFRYSS